MHTPRLAFGQRGWMKRTRWLGAVCAMLTNAVQLVARGGDAERQGSACTSSEVSQVVAQTDPCDADALLGSIGDGVVSAAPTPGAYTVTFYTRFAGPLRARMDIKQSGEHLKASTRSGVAWSMVGGLEGALGSLFVPFLFPDGKILTWETSPPVPPAMGAPEGVKGEGKIGIGTHKNMRVATVTRAQDNLTEVRYKDGRLISIFSLEPFEKEADERATDYAGLVRKSRELYDENIFDPGLVGARSTKKFFKEWESAAKKSRDDLEFLFGMGAAARSYMKESAPLLVPAGPGPEVEQVFFDKREPSLTRVEFREDGRVAVLRLDALYQGQELREAMRTIKDKGCVGLVIDMRSCNGIDLSGLGIAAWLAEKEVDVGIWADREHAEALTNPGSSSAPGFRVAGVEDGVAAQRELQARGAVHVTVVPSAERFTGAVAIIISKATKSSAEIVASMLQREGRAKIFGEATAGLPQLSREFEAGEGWTLRVPTDDFRAADGSAFAKVQPQDKRIGVAAIEAASRDMVKDPLRAKP